MARKCLNFNKRRLILLTFCCLKQVIEEENIQENCRIQGTYLLQSLAKLRDEFDIIGDVRGKGLMIGVELVTDKVIYK